MTKPFITTEDIFMKAALEFCRRNHEDPSKAIEYRDELAALAEKILSLKAVGAL